MTCSGSSDVPSLIHHSYHLEREGGGEREREREREREEGGISEGGTFEKVGNSHNASINALYPSPVLV